MSEEVWARYGRRLQCVAGMVTVCAILGGCATNAAPGAASTTAVPANYKQVITAEIRSWEDASAVQSGEISAPHERWMGLINGGTRPIVCVRLIKPLLFGNIGPAWYLFFFDNGKPDYVRLGSTGPYSQVDCGHQQMMPFTEVARRR